MQIRSFVMHRSACATPFRPYALSVRVFPMHDGLRAMHLRNSATCHDRRMRHQRRAIAHRRFSSA